MTSGKKHKREKQKSLSELKTLGQQLLSSKAHINNLPILLSFITPSSPPQFALESLLSLQSFFTPHLPHLPSSKYSNPHSPANPDPDLIYLTWLRSKFDDFISCLTLLASSSQCDDALREVVLDSIMECVKVGNAGKFHSAIYHKLINAVLDSESEVFDVLLELLDDKYLNYVDVRYFTYIILEKQALTLERKADVNVKVDADNKVHSRPSMELFIERLYKLISHIPPFEVTEEKLNFWSDSGNITEKSNNKEHAAFGDEHAKSQKFNSKVVLSPKNAAKKLKQKYTKFWISFLRLPLPLDVYKEVLATLHQAVIPYLSNPIMLSDFLTLSYDIGGVVSVMALSSLYILMTKHGLEYPDFYNKLYALLEPSVFMAKHRAKFFELLDSCLKSSLLPAYLAAAFCKKLSRLALFAPPSGALIIIVLVINLLQRHPSINCLIHKEGGSDSAEETSEETKISSQSAKDCSPISNLFEEKPGVDHFINEEKDPKSANAMRSSLWEIDTLRHHYSPPVSRFVMSLENDLAVRARTAEFAVKDFSSGSYATIFNDEIRRRVKQVPLAFYKATPTSLFSELNFPGWSFKSKVAGSVATNGTSDDRHDPSAKRKRA